jgi:hypothetical protein
LIGGGSKGFSSTSIFFDFGAITVKIPASQTNVSGDDSGFGWLTKNKEKMGKTMLWCDEKKYYLLR